MNALNLLKTELGLRNGLIADIAKNQLEVCRDWSYQIAVNIWSDNYVPGDEWIEAVSDSLYITFTGGAFVAKDETGITVALEPVEDGDIESAACGMAETLEELLPERDIAEEIAEAKAEDALWRLEAIA